MPSFKPSPIRSRDLLVQFIWPKSMHRPAQPEAWRWSGFSHRVWSFSFTIGLFARPTASSRPSTSKSDPNRRRLLVLLLLGFGFMSACASRDEKEGVRWSTDPEVSGQAHPAAYGVTDTFYVGKPQAIRPANDAVFYYKKCSMQNASGERAFFTKTEYNCNDPR
ncbi:MAG TPA: hypothetical protein PLZ57_02670 [Pseudobdellovibrionaceae bacterium]|nr:hypothetical protein [Pseudobdellovibrionaceae bacterium]